MMREWTGRGAPDPGKTALTEKLLFYPTRSISRHGEGEEGVALCDFGLDGDREAARYLRGEHR